MPNNEDKNEWERHVQIEMWKDFKLAVSGCVKNKFPKVQLLSHIENAYSQYGAFKGLEEGET